MIAPGDKASPPFSGPSQELGSNCPFPLAEDGVWYVERGEVDVFSVLLAGGVAAGPRKHLLRVPGGGLVLGIDPGSPEGRGFLGVATNGTRLVRATRAALGAALAQPQSAERARRLIAGWIEIAQQAIRQRRSAKPGLDLLPGSAVEVEARTVASAGSPGCWVRLLAGRAFLFGREDLAISADDRYFPLGGSTFLELDAGTRLTGAELTALTDQQVQAGLAWLGTILRQFAELQADEDERAALDRAERMATADQETIRRACARLAATMQPDGASLLAAAELGPEAPAAEANQALVACCRLVAAEIGVTIRAPAEALAASSKRDPLAAIMRSSRLRTRQVALRGAWWRSDHGPLVASIAEGKRPVALLRARGGYELHDPVAPSDAASARLVDEKTAAALSPFAHMIYRPFPDRALGVLSLLEFGVRGSFVDLRRVAILGAAVTLLGMAPALATGLLFNSIIPGAQRSQLWQMVVLVIACAVGQAGCSITRGLALLRAQQRMGISVQAAVWDRLMRLPLTFFRPYTAGDLANRAMSIDGIQQLLSGLTINAILNLLSSAGNLALMFWYSPPMAARAVLLLAVATAVTLLGGFCRLEPERAMLKVRAKTAGLVLQLLASISKLRVAGAEARAFARWVDRFAEQRRLQFKVRLTANWLTAFNAAFPVLASAGILMTGLPLLAEPGPAQALSTGDFLAFGTAFSACLSALLSTCRAVTDSLGSVALYDQARPILVSMPEVQVGKSDPGALSGDIEIQHAVFRYHDDGPPALRDISLHVRPGEFVALVGPSGSGKSTLLKLLLGFEKLESGSIYFDGQEIGGLDIQEVRRQIGVVLQNGRLVVGDVFRNIVGSGNATQEEAWEAARMAGIADDIRAMPMKMHTIVGEDAGTLSGGQRQRLMIARAIVNRPRILLFDEATSALDNRTQAIVTNSLERLQATRLIVAHRLSTITKADRIFVLERGRIVQEGGYRQLLDERGLFADLASRQQV
jgi:NHLM bacteriocin system ABC transporter ATP-binding protein